MSSRPPRVVAGTAVLPIPPAAIPELALRLAGEARRLGFAVIRIEASRNPTSRSRYLHLADVMGRRWAVRVSNHYRPLRSGHDEPHFDLVSQDGVSGLDVAVQYLGRIARGEVAWTNPEACPAPRRDRPRRQHRREKRR